MTGGKTHIALEHGGDTQGAIWPLYCYRDQQGATLQNTGQLRGLIPWGKGRGLVSNITSYPYAIWWWL